jgi:hypothetical protein
VRVVPPPAVFAARFALPAVVFVARFALPAAVFVARFALPAVVFVARFALPAGRAAVRFAVRFAVRPAADAFRCTAAPLRSAAPGPLPSWSSPLAAAAATAAPASAAADIAALGSTRRSRDGPFGGCTPGTSTATDRAARVTVVPTKPPARNPSLSITVASLWAS